MSFLFFPASTITQLDEDSFKLVDVYGGEFLLSREPLIVYLTQNEDGTVSHTSKEFEISGEIRGKILNDLIENKIVYPTKIRKEPAFNKRRVLKQIETPFEKPRTLNVGDVTLELTQNCPYHCEGCFREIDDGAPTPDSILEKTIYVLTEMGLSKLSLSGGEITATDCSFDRFRHIAGHAKKTGVEKVRLLTSGFSPKRVREGLDYVDEVQISVDGLEEEHDSYKNFRGAFERAVESIKSVEGTGVRLTTNTVVSQKNLSSIPELIDYLSRFNIDTLRITKIMSPRKDLRLGVDDARKLYELVKRKQKEHPKKRIINAYSDCTGVLNCVGGIAYAHIGATGNVFPCDYDIENSAGNIKDEAFQEIWTNSPVLQEYRRPNTIKGDCHECSDRALCFGNCRIDKKYVQETRMCKNDR